MKLESKLKVYEKDIQFKGGNKFLCKWIYIHILEKNRECSQKHNIGHKYFRSQKRRARKYTGQTQTIYFLK